MSSEYFLDRNIANAPVPLKALGRQGRKQGSTFEKKSNAAAEPEPGGKWATGQDIPSKFQNLPSCQKLSSFWNPCCKCKRSWPQQVCVDCMKIKLSDFQVLQTCHSTKTRSRLTNRDSLQLFNQTVWQFSLCDMATKLSPGQESSQSSQSVCEHGLERIGESKKGHEQP